CRRGDEAAYRGQPRRIMTERTSGRNTGWNGLSGGPRTIGKAATAGQRDITTMARIWFPRHVTLSNDAAWSATAVNEFSLTLRLTGRPNVARQPSSASLFSQPWPVLRAASRPWPR